MVKLLFSAVGAATLCVSNAAGQSLVQRSDWQDSKFETYLPKLKAIRPGATGHEDQTTQGRHSVRS
jgi:hypothetical protein